MQLPDDPLLGRTHYTVGLIEGGVAPNVVSPHASAELLFRTVASGDAVREALHVVEGLVAVEHVLDIPAVRMHTVPGFETAVFPYTTDVPLLTRWGTPLLVGPGSIHVAHTDEEHRGHRRADARPSISTNRSQSSCYRDRVGSWSSGLLRASAGPCSYATLDVCRGRRCTRLWVSRTAARTLCNFSLRTASGPEGSSAK